MFSGVLLSQYVLGCFSEKLSSISWIRSTLTFTRFQHCFEIFYGSLITVMSGKMKHVACLYLIRLVCSVPLVWLVPSCVLCGPQALHVVAIQL